MIFFFFPKVIQIGSANIFIRSLISFLEDKLMTETATTTDIDALKSK
jgi:hypothetical protein